MKIAEPFPGLSPRWRIVVHPGHRELYASLAQIFKENPEVGVVLDRRVKERRKHEAAASVERRRTDRRRPTSPEQLDMSLQAGFQLIDAGAARDRRLRELLEAALRLLSPPPATPAPG